MKQNKFFNYKLIQPWEEYSPLLEIHNLGMCDRLLYKDLSRPPFFLPPVFLDDTFICLLPIRLRDVSSRHSKIVLIECVVVAEVVVSLPCSIVAAVASKSGAHKYEVHNY